MCEYLFLYIVRMFIVETIKFKIQECAEQTISTMHINNKNKSACADHLILDDESLNEHKV